MVKDMIVIEDAENVAGRIVYGKLSGSVDLADLTAAWEKRDLPMEILPSPCTTEHALRTAFNEHTKTRGIRVLVRPLPDKVSGYALVNEAGYDEDLVHAQTLKCKIDKESVLHFAPKDHFAIEQIRHSYEINLATLDTILFSGWLWRKVMYWLSAVALRPKGGIYFIPREKIPLWEKVVSAIDEVSGHEIYSIPAMKTQDAIEAILDAVLSDAQRSINEIETGLQDAMDGDMGKRAVKHRVTMCQRASKKLEAYDVLLGNRLEDIKSKLVNLEEKFSVAMLLGYDDQTGGFFNA